MGASILVFEVNVIPKPKQRPRAAIIRAGKKLTIRSFTPPETVKYQENFAKEVLFQMAADHKVFEEPCVVFLQFFKKDNRHCDIDNFVKAAMDAVNEILYKDDYLVQVVHAEMEKDSICPRSIMAVMSLDEYRKNPGAVLTEWYETVENNRKAYKGKSI